MARSSREIELDHIGLLFDNRGVAREWALATLGVPIESAEWKSVPEYGCICAYPHPLIEIIVPVAKESPLWAFLKESITSLHHIALRNISMPEYERVVGSLAPITGARGDKCTFVKPFWGILVEIVE